MPLTGIGPKAAGLALRGGGYRTASGAGLFGLLVYYVRTFRYRHVGFRPALAPNRQKPGGYGCRDGTGVKGGRFLPGAKRGNNSTPARPVALQTRRGSRHLREVI